MAAAHTSSSEAAGRMRPIALAVLAVVLSLCVSPRLARAQSFYVHAASLVADGERVADLAGPVSAAFGDGTRVQVQYASPEVTLAGELDLADPDDFLAAGVARDVRLEATGIWSITLRAGTWAPVVGNSPAGVVIALPPSMPTPRATIPRGTPGARGRPGGAETWDGPGRDTTPAESDPVARYVSLRAGHQLDSPMWASPGGAAVSVVGRIGDDRVVEIAFHGIVVRGFVEARAPLYLTPHDVAATTAAVGLATVGTFAPLRGRAVGLPAGTALYATRDATREIAVLNAPAVGYEPLFSAPATFCTSGPPVTCERQPPEPRGPARWVIQLRGAQITAWARTPAEQLARTPASAATYAALREPGRGPSGWPRPARVP